MGQLVNHAQITKQQQAIHPMLTWYWHDVGQGWDMENVDHVYILYNPRFQFSGTLGHR